MSDFSSWHLTADDWTFISLKVAANKAVAKKPGWLFSKDMSKAIMKSANWITAGRASLTKDWKEKFFDIMVALGHAISEAAAKKLHEEEKNFACFGAECVDFSEGCENNADGRWVCALCGIRLPSLAQQAAEHYEDHSAELLSEQFSKSLIDIKQCRPKNRTIVKAVSNMINREELDAYIEKAKRRAERKGRGKAGAEERASIVPSAWSQEPNDNAIAEHIQGASGEAQRALIVEVKENHGDLIEDLDVNAGDGNDIEAPFEEERELEQDEGARTDVEGADEGKRGSGHISRMITSSENPVSGETEFTAHYTPTVHIIDFEGRWRRARVTMRSAPVKSRSSAAAIRKRMRQVLAANAKAAVSQWAIDSQEKKIALIARAVLFRTSDLRRRLGIQDADAATANRSRLLLLAARKIAKSLPAPTQTRATESRFACAEQHGERSYTVQGGKAKLGMTPLPTGIRLYTVGGREEGVVAGLQVTRKARDSTYIFQLQRIMKTEHYSNAGSLVKAAIMQRKTWRDAEENNENGLGALSLPYRGHLTLQTAGRLAEFLRERESEGFEGEQEKSAKIRRIEIENKCSNEAKAKSSSPSSASSSA